MIVIKHWHRLLVTLAAIAALAAFAAACDDDEEGDEGTPAVTTPAADGERIQGGELIVRSVEFDSLDPHFSSFAQDISLHRMLWRGLYTMNADNEPQPAMAAEDPEVSEDGRTYTVTLRDGLQWSDGDDLKAEDFVKGVQRTCNPINAGEYQYVLSNVLGCDDYFAAEDASAEDLASLEEAVGVRAVDDTTVEFTLIEPQPTFPIILSLWMTFPVPVHLDRFANDTPDAPGEWGTDPATLAYNGPYVLVSYSPQEEVVLQPNPNWVGDIKPTLDRLTIKFIDDTAQAVNAFRTGELDQAHADLTQLETIVSEFGDGEEYFKAIKPSTRGLEMQLNVPPLDILEVRLALSQAIDRAELNRVVAQGGNEPATSWIPEVSGGHPPDEFDDEIGFNPEQAKANLEAAGFPNGQGFPTLTILVGDSPTARRTGEFLQQSFRTHLNIETNVEVVDSATRSSRFTNQQFELFPGGWIQDYPDPENWVLGLFNTGGTLNNYNCSDPDIDDLVSRAQFNTNEDERLDQYKQINELIATRVCGIAPYWHENDHYLIKTLVVGMRENIAGQDAVMPGDWIAEAWGRSQ